MTYNQFQALLRAAVKKHHCVYDSRLAGQLVEWLSRTILASYNVEADEDWDTAAEIVQDFAAMWLQDCGEAV